jgi:hypothetical protein
MKREQMDRFGIAMLFNRILLSAASPVVFPGLIDYPPRALTEDAAGAGDRTES